MRKLIQDLIRKHCNERGYTELKNARVVEWKILEIRDDFRGGKILIVDADVKFKEWEGYTGANFTVAIYDNGYTENIVYFQRYIEK